MWSGVQDMRHDFTNELQNLFFFVCIPHMPTSLMQKGDPVRHAVCQTTHGCEVVCCFTALLHPFEEGFQRTGATWSVVAVEQRHDAVIHVDTHECVVARRFAVDVAVNIDGQWILCSL